MLNFTVGPVQSSEAVRAIGAQNVPYFRTPEFSEVMLENEALVKEFTQSGDQARVLFITGSGTASMEASVMNMLTKKDKVLVVNGGSFGQRFVDICKIHEIPYTEIVPTEWLGIQKEDLNKYEGKDYTAFLVNIDETSTGVLYDIKLISDFCKRNHLFLIVDSISSFLCDPLNMQEYEVDCLITGSQKALACPPGVSVIVCSPKAIERIQVNEVKSLYFDLKLALSNGERGQTPFTPAVGTLLQINQRLKDIKAAGGVEAEIARIHALAEDFREKIKAFPFEIVSKSLPNAVTALKPTTANASDIFRILKDEYQIWVCPNGGLLKELVFRVGHIGALTKEDNTTLINALADMQRRNLI
ncbi:MULTISPECIES: alanine--glyoxylate aminotransferase family protein [Terrabacteria group]|uniref:pyridoxal-phosphate-dependent aminotransferase family protein n=1 Tax=Bacillati TaxID=1783272 RepID=UPI001C6F0CA2|nr:MULTISPECIES: aminotransferase class V-fold PLP-dependent enzyme [Terrabacteria group]MBW9211937.1 aminotransferase class V-fold PLP-dependent enzyme [Trueperella sp. zg.1013]